MGDYIQVLLLIVVGILLFGFGYTLFFGPLSSFFPGLFPWSKWGKKPSDKGMPGEPRVCPLCSYKLDKGENIQTFAFPSLSGGKDRLMYIKGCFTCLNNKVTRRCPVCGIELSLEDYLVSRMYERTHTRPHIHVIGCNHCKNMGTLAK